MKKLQRERQKTEISAALSHDIDIFAIKIFFLLSNLGIESIIELPKWSNQIFLRIEQERERERMRRRRRRRARDSERGGSLCKATH